MDGEAWVSPTAERTGTEPHEDRTSVAGHPRGLLVSNAETQPRWGVTTRCVSEVRQRDVHDAPTKRRSAARGVRHGADA